jgi:NAD(P)H dehydrogenase (quinone)
MNEDQAMFVIFGASGKVGSITVKQLRAAGHAVRAVVRSDEQASRFSAMGCETAVADLTDLDSVQRAIKEATAVQILCPIPAGDADPESSMRAMIDIAVQALRADTPPAVLALSDYGAELQEGTGITLLYHYLEQQLRSLPTRLTFLRAAEHIQNWARLASTALQTGMLPSLHHPLHKLFPTVSATDVGVMAAQLLAATAPSHSYSHSPRIVSVEGPRRVSANDVAAALSSVFERKVTGVELPRGQWETTLQRAGLSENHTKLITELYDTHNAGKIDFESGNTERRFGSTELTEALAAMLPARSRGEQPA